MHVGDNLQLNFKDADEEIKILRHSNLELCLRIKELERELEREKTRCGHLRNEFSLIRDLIGIPSCSSQSIRSKLRKKGKHFTAWI